MNETRLAERLDDVAAAEARLLRTLDSLDDGDLGVPSLCEGWTRGHVLAHVALNAHSIVNLFEWARTGTETPQYPGWEERNADIDRFAGRSAEEHRAALTAAGSAFAAAARAVPADRWVFPVRGIGGDPQPAETFLFGRLREVEIHHVDLAAGYAPHDWPGDFVRAVLDQVPRRLGPRVREPFVGMGSDLGARVQIGDGAPRVEVAGPASSLLAWLLGRSDGSDLAVTGGGLPQVPSWG
ncbi:MAG TPA: maleylpyruvate isomerase family mycothiol-dependent enzyme [Actinomycetota bacterium]|nr:maleylpyruvate isomerase family mycothiol-dependent enzyme [Actinomycetota bacterium]